jgi:ribosomal protein S27AE
VVYNPRGVQRITRQCCRACGSDLLAHLVEGLQAWQCQRCGLAGGRDLVGVRWQEVSAGIPDAPQVERWKTAINALRRAQMLLLMLRWALQTERSDDTRVFNIRVSVLVWSSKCIRDAASQLGGWLYVSEDERWDLWEFEACLDNDLRVLTGEAASVFASPATYLEALVERHLASVQMLVERSEHLVVSPIELPGRRTTAD